ncbi:MAG: hypothetical protein WKF43_04290 [Acidimicrobiales bacterium]
MWARTLTDTVRAYENGDVTGRSRSYADAVLVHQREVIAEFKGARAERDRLSREATTARRAAATARDSIADNRADLAEAKLRTQVLSDQAAREVFFGQAARTELQGKKLEIEARIIGSKESTASASPLPRSRRTSPTSYPDRSRSPTRSPGSRSLRPSGCASIRSCTTPGCTPGWT